MIRIYRISLFVLLFLSGSTLWSQSTKVLQDAPQPDETGKFELSIDLISRYLWRGQCWGGDYVAVQPTINFAATDKFTIGFWATSNFKKDYFYPDGVTSYKGYQEMDFNISYQVAPFLSLQLWDYYWPTVSPVEGVTNSFFDYSVNGVKTVDAMLVFDFSEYRFPLNATVSTLVAGNDFRLDENGGSPKQNYTTYTEVGYTLEELYKKVTVGISAGVVWNNQAAYYTAGDYDKPSLVNFSVKATREFPLSNRITLPVSVNYIYNGAQRNTEIFGRNFWVAGITFHYQ